MLLESFSLSGRILLNGADADISSCHVHLRSSRLYYSDTDMTVSLNSICDTKMYQNSFFIPSELGYKQFYETYKGNKICHRWWQKIPWTNNLIMMKACKTDEMREFYIRSCMETHYSNRELERHIDSMRYERTVVSDAKYGALAKKE